MLWRWTCVSQIALTYISDNWPIHVRALGEIGCSASLPNSVCSPPPPRSPPLSNNDDSVWLSARTGRRSLWLATAASRCSTSRPTAGAFLGTCSTYGTLAVLAWCGARPPCSEEMCGRNGRENLFQERDFRVTGGLAWCGEILVAACQELNSGKHEVRRRVLGFG